MKTLVSGIGRFRPMNYWMSLRSTGRLSFGALRLESIRKGVWTPSAQLTGAVAQAQEYLRVAVKQLDELQRFTDETGAPTSEELFVVQPRSYLVIGSLSEFLTDRGANVQKYVAFEDYRRNLRQPEIITFDELYERARFIVEHSAGGDRAPEVPDEVPF